MAVYKRGNNYCIDFYFQGRRIQRVVGSDKKLAEMALKKKQVDIARGEFLDVRRKEKIKFEEFSDTFINIWSKPNKRSWKCDISNLKALSPFFKGKYLYEITTEKIEEFKAERSKTVAPATVNRELATLGTMLNKAVAWGKLEKSPAQNVKFLREPKGRLRYLEIAEIQRLIINCSDKLRPIVILALNTGMRRGEILGLKWKDNIDFQREIIRITDTKNGEVKTLPMNATVKQTLMKISRNPNSPFVFCGKDGQPYHDIRKSFFTALKEADIMDFRFHDLRHTYASQLVMSGIDINTTRELLGHKDLRMTLRYAHLSPDHKKRATDLLGQRLGAVVLKSSDNLVTEPILEIPKKLTVSQLLENVEVI